MADYHPPLRDIKFVLQHVTDLPAVSGLDGMEHADPETVFTALDEAGRFMTEVVAPTNRAGDLVGSRRNDDGTVTTPEGFADAYRQFVAAGWPAVPYPSEWGGHGFPWLVGTALQEMLKSANMALALCPMLTQSAVVTLAEHGSEEQKAVYLEKLISSEWSGTMCLTEPEAGSDVGALRTRAEPAGDGSWRLRGTKIFITWGEQDLTDNIVHLVLARTPDSPPGTRGISLFLVPKFIPAADGSPGERNDVHCVSVEHKLGIHGSPTCVMAFGEGDGAVGYLIGEERQGMHYMFTMMNHARLAVGLEGLSISERAYQQALAYAEERRQGRAVGAPRTEQSPIIEHPDVRRMLMTMKAYIEAMRCLLYFDAEALDLSIYHSDPGVREANASLLRLLTPVSKAWPTDLGIELTSLGIQVHGGMGYVEETGAAQHFRDSRISAIYEGTNGIQAIDLVLRALPLDGGAVARGLLDRVAETVDSLGGDAAPIGHELAAALAALREATEWMATRDDPNDALAGASPYLRMFGTTLGGWLMARSAVAAKRLLSSGEGDPDFLEAKLATARFYAEQLLPQVGALLPAATAGAAPLFAVEPKLLAR